MTKYIPHGKDFYLGVTLVNLSGPIEEGGVAWRGGRLGGGGVEGKWEH